LEAELGRVKSELIRKENKILTMETDTARDEYDCQQIQRQIGWLKRREENIMQMMGL
jgi:hypothetical protein